MSFDMGKAVIALIRSITSKLKIHEKDIITVGASKGGSAAIYYRVKYGFGNIIEGIPQTKIADYVLQATEETAEFMLGDINYTKRIDILNNVIFDLLKRK